MGIQHLRIAFHLITSNVYTWDHDLVEVRYTHVRDHIKHCTNIMHVYHMPNIIVSSLPMARRCRRPERRVLEAYDLDTVAMQNRFTKKKMSAELRDNLHNECDQLISGYRDVIRPIKVWSQRLQNV